MARFQAVIFRRCVMPTLDSGETTRVINVTASVDVSDGTEASCGFGAGCGSGVVKASVIWNVRSPKAGGARNAILFVADGMSLPMITAAR